MKFEVEGGGFNLPLANFLEYRNEKLERAFNFAREESKGIKKED